MRVLWVLASSLLLSGAPLVAQVHATDKTFKTDFRTSDRCESPS